MYKKFSCLIFIVCIWLNSVRADAYKVGQPPELKTLASNVEQVVYVSVSEADSIKAKMDLWEKSAVDGKIVWRLINVYPIPAVIGRNGLAAMNEKREGDGRTPSGTFGLRRTFGYESHVATGLSYQQVTGEDFWIDESTSPQYNQWVRGKIPQVSHETLRRSDDLYKYAIVVEYNTDPVVAGMGSAIFMHIWRSQEQPTAGCIAMKEEDILNLLHWLDEDRKPVVILKKN